jgi:hypothetical protein
LEDDLSPTWHGQSKWFSRYQAGTLVVSLGGGLLMLLLAPLAHDSASIPLLVIGALWTAMGLGGLRMNRRTFQAVRLESGGMVSFMSPGRALTIPVGEILEVRRARGDINRFSPLRVITRSHGTLAISPRLDGLIELLVELRAANPALRITRL